ncbi:hypothetical protein FA13DRAFT_827412 [Coprinellus micaceus]|uniref:Uncharacterized protein n=1 Tax=Coprinellus micaceus TaxID=71717 RepID=A0A4Y7T259_COPMI|nr:hypothetical protein FA13DRAFT_827412 [Coprinellus micaceus]
MHCPPMIPRISVPLSLSFLTYSPPYTHMFRPITPHLPFFRAGTMYLNSRSRTRKPQAASLVPSAPARIKSGVLAGLLSVPRSQSLVKQRMSATYPAPLRTPIHGAVRSERSDMRKYREQRWLHFPARSRGNYFHIPESILPRPLRLYIAHTL